MEIYAALEKATSFADLEKFCNKVEPQVSFLGCQYVVSAEYEGTLPIDCLIQRVKAVRAANLDFDEVERTHARNIVGRIGNIYEESDEQIEKRHSIIQWLEVFKYILGLFNERFRWEWHDCAFHVKYTEKQFETAFGFPPSEEGLSFEELRRRGAWKERSYLDGSVCWLVYSEYRDRFALPNNAIFRPLFIRLRQIQHARFGTIWI